MSTGERDPLAGSSVDSALVARSTLLIQPAQKSA
jgi:hypothetical protein